MQRLQLYLLPEIEIEINILTNYRGYWVLTTKLVNYCAKRLNPTYLNISNLQVAQYLKKFQKLFMKKIMSSKKSFNKDTLFNKFMVIKNV